ncbi:MAG: CHAT domain-containing protein [Acidobacteria bacterium]|nr:CHAT domain-containing protein [Acidobacteriota bacterium]
MNLGKTKPFAIFIAALLWFHPLGVGSPAASASSYSVTFLQESLAFAKGATFKREIQTGETLAFRVALAANHYLLLTVKQIAIDVIVALYAPDGEKVFAADNPHGLIADERLFLISKTSGDYRLEIRNSGKGAGRGSFEIHIEELHPATAQDHTYVAAEQLFQEAENLRAKGDAASLRLAIEKYEQYVPLAASLKEDTGGAVQMIGQSYRMLGDQHKALDYYQQALPLARAANNREQEAGILNSIGNALVSQGDAPNALTYYEQAIVILHELNLRLPESSLLNNLGFLYLSLNEADQALDYLKRALAIRQERGDIKGETITLGGLAQAYRDVGDFQTSLVYLNQAAQNLPNLKDNRIHASILNNLGTVNKEQGNDPEAIRYFEQTLALLANFAEPFLETSVLNNLGSLYFARGEAQQALSYFEKALVVSHKAQERQREARSLGNIGLAHEALGDSAKAWDFLNQALLIFQAIQDRNGEASVLQEMARIESQRGDLTRAQTRIETAINIIESLRGKISSQDLQTSFFASKQDAYDLHTDILMRLHEKNPSQNFAALALQSNERGRARSLLEMLNEARVQIHQGMDSNLWARRAALQKQINAKEQYRIRLLAGRHTEAQLANVEKELNELLIQFQEVRGKIRTSNPRYAAIMQPLPITVKEFQQQALDEETLLLEYALGKERSYLWVVTPTTLHSFALPGRLEIEAAARQLYDLLTARNQKSANQTVEQKLLRVKRSDDEFAKAAAQLSQMVLSPAAALLENKRLLIVADGALQYIPFAALPQPASLASSVRSPGSQENGKANVRLPKPKEVNPLQSSDARQRTLDYGLPLIVEHEIINLPSATVLTVLRRDAVQSNAPPKTLAILADPVFSDDDPRLKQALMGRSRSAPVNAATAPQVWSAALRSGSDSGVMEFRRLPSSGQEAEVISQLVAADNRLKATGFDANRATATNAELSRYRIVHFATHALMNSRHPELSGIVLSLVDEEGKAQDGFLRLHEIYNLKLAADLVVLSGCQTALGKEVRGEGLVGLTRGFMYAGTPRVIASLWKVDDKATADLMKQFYQFMLNDRMRPAAALRAAQIAMVKQNKAAYYWAAFALQGEWR